MENYETFENEKEEIDKINKLENSEKLNRPVINNSQNNLTLTRNIPHVEGNFACLIYLNISMNLGNKFNLLLNHIEQLLNNKIEINKELEKVNSENENFLNFNRIEKSKYHVSLSPTIYLKYHQVNSFLNSLKTKLKFFKSTLKLILTNKITYFKNEYSTSSFIGIEIIKNKLFNKLYIAITEVVESFGFSNSIDPKKITPHISLFSSNNDFNFIIPEEIMRDKISKLNNKDKGYLKILEFNELYITVGSKIEIIKLNI